MFWPLAARLHGLDVEIGYILNALEEARLNPQQVYLWLKSNSWISSPAKRYWPVLNREIAPATTKIWSRGVAESDGGPQSRHYGSMRVRSYGSTRKNKNSQEIVQLDVTDAVAYADFIRTGDPDGLPPCWGAIERRFETNFLADDDRVKLLDVLMQGADKRVMLLFLDSNRERPAVALSPVEVQEAVRRFVRFYNQHWRLAKLGYKSPVQARANWHAQTTAA